MALLKIKLSRNIRKHILRGHPWVYKDSIEQPKQKITECQLCLVLDPKGEELAWAMYDPFCPLSLRILNVGKPPNEQFYQARFQKAYNLRKSVRSELTTCYRLFNGEGDLLPGMICDVYDNMAVLQFDGEGPSQFWQKEFIADWILKNTHVETVVEKLRRSPDKSLILLGGKNFEAEKIVKENGVLFKVNVEKGQKTGFFLDQRDNRNYVRQMCRGQSLLNMFSYSGGFSIYAGLGGASRVASLDIASGAIDMANENWLLNSLPKEKHQGICMDVFEYLKNDPELWDHIIIDPPSMGHSEEKKALAMQKYIELFAAGAKRVVKNGHLYVSSCSSHISFNDFFEIINESLAIAKRKGQILRISGQGSDHPFPHSSYEFRYLKFVHIVLD